MAEAGFMYLLNSDIDKFDAFFFLQEEDIGTRLEKVIDKRGPNGTQLSEDEYRAEMFKIRKEIVNCHGEMVLFMNYSNVNYTGLSKILKKYDKRTCGVLRLPVIQKVLEACQGVRFTTISRV
ncbi:spx domain-containing protein 5 [Phtheirospermum japonicum]|uniref:Spx domain-containing protein 5 n=1 Tax=Phtheirospermum japonicum TaxID=374723 RepID=A0A830BFT0_9LAMI|nr:spx domain-containing protein 5 [Phtheirospermum japonicum]